MERIAIATNTSSRVKPVVARNFDFRISGDCCPKQKIIFGNNLLNLKYARCLKSNICLFLCLCFLPYIQVLIIGLYVWNKRIKHESHRFSLVIQMYYGRLHIPLFEKSDNRLPA